MVNTQRCWAKKRAARQRLSNKGGNVITHIQDKAIPDGWSRGIDGTLTMPGLTAFQLFGALIRGDVPGYAANLNIKPAMSFPEFLEVNGIQIQGDAS